MQLFAKSDTNASKVTVKRFSGWRCSIKIQILFSCLCTRVITSCYNIKNLGYHPLNSHNLSVSLCIRRKLMLITFWGLSIAPLGCNQHQASENMGERVTIGFGFTSHWLKKWH